MQISLTINHQPRQLAVQPGELLLTALRRAGYTSVKHGCETGECGACAVLLDGRPVTTCTLLAAQADGHSIITVEGLVETGLPQGAAPMVAPLHPLQQAFVETGAIQCGYCTPAMLLAAQALLDREPNPTEHQVRDALSGTLCRCTGYLKPVEAVLRAAAVMRGEAVPPIGGEGGIPIEHVFGPTRPGTPHSFPPPPAGEGEGGGFPPVLAGEGEGGGRTQTQVRLRVLPMTTVTTAPEMTVVGKPEIKVDAAKLAKGKPVFTDDVTLPGILHAALLTSPHAHARIRHIDTSKARALPGVHAVLTYQDVPRVAYASGGQSWPNPPPYDQFSLDRKVRHVGDRVAVVAAESPEIARRALDLIEVDYEVLPAVFDPEAALKSGAPVIHDEPDAVKIKDASRNLVAHIEATVGDPDQGLAAADLVVEREYRVHQVQQASIEPHVCITYWDEDDRLVVRTSTQVPFHVRRMLAPLIGLPVKRIRVVKPRIGGGFGGKQEMLIEDLCAHLTIATGRPVRFEYTRELEFTSARSRHPQILRYKAGVKRDGTLHALELRILADTGAYGTHAITVQTVSGLRGLSTYRCPNMRFDCDIVYTNKPVAGAFRGYGAPQALFALECLMDEIATGLGMDVIEFRRKNWVRVGDPLPLAKALGEAREGHEQIIQSSGLEECVERGAAAIDWNRKKVEGYRLKVEGSNLQPSTFQLSTKRGLGMAVCMHGTAIAGLDMGAASLKMNDDGSFNLLVGATDLGTGSDTVLAQIAAETLGVPLQDIIVHSSDTDFTPFDTGAYASSTTYISGGAVKKAADQVRDQIIQVAAQMLGFKSVEGSESVEGYRLKVEGSELVNLQPSTFNLRDRRVWAPDGRSVSLAEVALHSLHQENQHQIMATASHMSLASPPPFAAQFAEVEVDTETGQVMVTRLVMAVDCGTAINPVTATGQVEGGMIQALGYAISEEMVYDERGRLLTTRFGDYRIFQADEVPELQVILVPTYEPTGPYGAKAVAEIPMDGVAPAVANAIYDAVGVRLRQLPFTPERVWRALAREQGS